MSAQPSAPVPPLENGDRLTRPEFERRYEAAHLKKAELIEGVVYVPAAVRITSHGRPHAQIMAWLTAYWIATPGVDIADNTTVRLDFDNEPQPDALLRIEPEVGGQSRISSDGYVEGPPELIVEVAASSASYDLGDKLKAYCRNGVQEYVVWQIYENRLDWFRLQNGQYVAIEPDATGLLASRIFPGLRLDRAALLKSDLATVLAKLQQGFGTPEHQALIEHLKTS